MPIYTRTGDTGETSLFGGTRIKKHAPIVELYGSFDELNSWVGLVITQLQTSEKKVFLQKLQTDLFTIQGFLAGWKEADLSMLSARVTEMEVEIDVMGKALPTLNNFILPGGSIGASYAHITRTVCRRVERQLVSFFHTKAQPEQLEEQKLLSLIQYINRLSDLFFQLARFINKQAGEKDITWSGIIRKK